MGFGFSQLRGANTALTISSAGQRSPSFGPNQICMSLFCQNPIILKSMTIIEITINIITIIIVTTIILIRRTSLINHDNANSNERARAMFLKLVKFAGELGNLTDDEGLSKPVAGQACHGVLRVQGFGLKFREKGDSKH